MNSFNSSIERKTRNQKRNIMKRVNKAKLPRLSTSNESQCTINSLNDDCLAEIFMKLPFRTRFNMGTVCQKWKRASEISWYNAKIFDFQSFDEFSEDLHYLLGDPDALLNWFFNMKPLFEKCGKFVEIFDMFWIDNSAIIPVITLNFPNLRILKLTLKKRDDKDFINAFSNMENLEELQIIWAFQARQFDENILSSFVVPDQIKKLTFINYCSYLEILPNSFISNLNRLESLEALELRYFQISQQLVEAISLRKNLTKLVLKSNGMNDQVNIYSISYLEKLEIIDVSRNLNIDKFLINISKNSKNLKKLYLNDTNVSDLGLIALSQLDKLEVLKMMRNRGDPHDSVTGASIHKFKNLIKFTCEGYKYVQKKSIFQLVENSPNLKELNLVDTITVKPRFIRKINLITSSRKNSSLSMKISIHKSSKILQVPDSHLNLDELFSSKYQKSSFFCIDSMLIELDPFIY